MPRIPLISDKAPLTDPRSGLLSTAGRHLFSQILNVLTQLVTGPSTSTIGNLATWASTDGTLLQDGGPPSPGGITQLTGDVTAGPGSGSQPATIVANAVTNAKAAQMAAHTFKGNNTGSTANPLDLTDTQATAELNAMVGDTGSGGTKGLVPAPAAGDTAAGKFLKADGTFAVPPGGAGSALNVSYTSGIVAPVIPPIASSGWSWVNQGSATLAQVDSALAMHIPDNASLNFRVYVRGALSGAYTVTAHLAQANQSVNSQVMGLYLYDSGSGKLESIELLTQAGPVQTLEIRTLANATTSTAILASQSVTSPFFGFQDLLSFRVVDDTVNRSWFYSGDRGINWYLVYQEPTNTFLTPNQAGFGGLSVVNNVANFVDVSLLSWSGA